MVSLGACWCFVTNRIKGASQGVPSQCLARQQIGSSFSTRTLLLHTRPPLLLRCQNFVVDDVMGLVLSAITHSSWVRHERKLNLPKSPDAHGTEAANHEPC